MTDPLAASGQQLPPEIAEIVRQMVDDRVESRVAGLQKVIGRKDQELRELKAAGMDPEQRAQYQQDALQAENDRLQAIIEMNRLSAVHPNAAPILQQLVAIDDTEGQLSLLETWAKTLKTPPAAATPPPAPGSVDPNHAGISRPGESTTLADGTEMDEARADMLLGSYSGALRAQG